MEDSLIPSRFNICASCYYDLTHEDGNGCECWKIQKPKPGLTNDRKKTIELISKSLRNYEERKIHSKRKQKS